jgi:hypothetical protein
MIYSSSAIILARSPTETRDIFSEVCACWFFFHHFFNAIDITNNDVYTSLTVTDISFICKSLLKIIAHLPVYLLLDRNGRTVKCKPVVSPMGAH